MTYQYNPAKSVISPLKNVKNVRVLSDGGAAPGAYSVAIIEWNGEDVLAIRWNISENEVTRPDKLSGAVICLGEPNSHGKSTWFVLPDGFLEGLIGNGSLADDVTNYLSKKGEK